MLIPALQAARAEGFSLVAIIGQTSTTGLPSFQDTGALGSRDRELLDALQIPAVSIGCPMELPAVHELACEVLAAGRPAALTIPSDILAAPWSPAGWESLPPQQALNRHRPSREMGSSALHSPRIWSASSMPCGRRCWAMANSAPATTSL